MFFSSVAGGDGEGWPVAESHGEGRSRADRHLVPRRQAAGGNVEGVDRQNRRRTHAEDPADVFGSGGNLQVRRHQ